MLCSICSESFDTDLRPAIPEKQGRMTSMEMRIRSHVMREKKEENQLVSHFFSDLVPFLRRQHNS